MFKNQFDEYQLSIRYKVAGISLGLTFILMFINAVYVESVHVWAPPTVQALAIITIVTAFFITVTTFKNAYIAIEPRSARNNLLAFLFAGIITLLPILSHISKDGFDYFYYNNAITSSSGIVFLSIYNFYAAFITAIKISLNKLTKD